MSWPKTIHQALGDIANGVSPFDDLLDRPLVMT